MPKSEAHRFENEPGLVGERAVRLTRRLVNCRQSLRNSSGSLAILAASLIFANIRKAPAGGSIRPELSTAEQGLEARLALGGQESPSLLAQWPRVSSTATQLRSLQPESGS
jgi:hypothetical protein